MGNNLEDGVILAAGFGKRLRPHTLTLPKPLVPAGGHALIDYALGHYQRAGMRRVTVNTHYLADKLETYLDVFAARTPDITVNISFEAELLDTGGGLKKMLPLIAGDCFFVQSGDSLLQDGPAGCALKRMEAAWDPEKMDILLLLQPRDKMTLTGSTGDYDLDECGMPVRSDRREGAYMWTSVRVCHRRIFDRAPDGPFSFLTLMDRAQEQGRLYAIIHDGDWHHISSHDDLERVNEALAGQKRLAL